MASGEALIMKDIVPNASMPAMTEAMKRGWGAAISTLSAAEAAVGRRILAVSTGSMKNEILAGVDEATKTRKLAACASIVPFSRATI
jgi:hypothetical protein